MQDAKLHKGPWLEEEDELLVTAVAILGERKWDALAKTSGLRRSGKSCRLRWVNYLRPNLKHGRLTEEEERVIIQLHEKWGNKWSRIAQSLPGRTDNEIKNYWRRRLSRKTSLVEQKVNTSDKNPSTAKCGEVTPLSRNDECASYKDEIFGSSTDTSIGIELWSEQAHSPYELRLSEWISNLSPEQSVMQTLGDLWNFDNV